MADADVDRDRVTDARSASGVMTSHSEAIASFLDDAQITATVKGALISEFGVASRSIHVETADSVVTLSGDVGTDCCSTRLRCRSRAIRLGVSDVVDAVAIRDIASIDFWPMQFGPRPVIAGNDLRQVPAGRE